MKVTYLRLDNFAVISVAQEKDSIEIHFPESGNKIVSIQGTNGVGKAQPISTKIPVPTKERFKKLGDLQVGDEVFGSDGKPTKVLSIQDHGPQKIYQIIFADGRSAYCCKDHLWKVYYGSHGCVRSKIIPLKEMLLDYRRYCPEKEGTNHDKYSYKYRVDNLHGLIEFQHTDVPIHPYVLGAFIGNGCCREEALSISSGNDFVPNKIAMLCGFHVRRNSMKTYTYQFYDKDTGRRIYTKDFFKDVPEMIGTYSYDKIIPENYLYNDPTVRMELLRGLMDTDGSISDNDNRFSTSYSTTSVGLSIQIIELLKMMGYNGRVTFDARLKYTKGILYDVFCSIPNEIKHELFTLPEKLRIAEKCMCRKNSSKNYEYNGIRAITFSHIESARCIHVDSDDELYVTEDYVVTHNSGLISNITPFAYPSNIDERSGLSSIVEGKSGYKEIHYKKGNDQFIIKHYYKPNKNTHTVKSYIALNGEELNDNGNVSSFLSLVEIHFGLTQDMMRLLRLGSNVHSFISLTPAKRKEYIGSLIEEIDMYRKIYRKVNEDLRVLKVLINSNNQNLYNCHISSIEEEEERVKDLRKELKRYESDRDQLVKRISKIESLERENNLNDLQRKKQEAEASMIEFQHAKEKMMERNLESSTVDQLVAKRNDYTNQRIETQSKINSYRISIDNALKQSERLHASVQKVMSNNDLESLSALISDLRDRITVSEKILKGFIAHGCSSEELGSMISKLSSFNQVGQMIYTLGKKPVQIYLKLRRENTSIDRFLKEQMKKHMSRINEDDIRKLFSQAFQDDDIITPNCDTQFKECPYYRFSEVLHQVKDKLEEETLDDETIRYIGVISNNVDRILNELDIFLTKDIPDRLKDDLKEKSLLRRLEENVTLFPLSSLQEYQTIVKEYEIYQDLVHRLQQSEQQLKLYKSSGIDTQIEEIESLKENISFYQKNIQVLGDEMKQLQIALEQVDVDISIVSKYTDGKKYQKMIQSTLESVNKILIPLESASKEKMELSFQLRTINDGIHNTQDRIKSIEYKIAEYNRLVEESEILAKKQKDLSIIMDAVSTKKGIPVIYMKTYLGKIQTLANNLLSIIYGDDLRLAKFKVTHETFEIPYIRNGRKIPDVRFASQSEIPLTTMALSFALSHKATEKYNIILLDEIDAGFDEHNRSAFLKMLHRQMVELKAEQVFIISHNLNNIIDIPVDVIKLSDVGGMNKLQNIIYE